MDYFDIYQKRLNRYGLDYQTRIQKQRERDFENKLLKSVYRVDFEYCGEMLCGTLEKYKQDETQTLQYLLTKTNIELPNGTILMIVNRKGVETPWMVYWQEEIQASGYNKYVMVKMTHFISWKDRDGIYQKSWAYMYGQEDNMLKDELRSRSRSNAYYTENLKMSFFLMPTNIHLKKDDYIEIGEGELKEAYRVVGYDIQSTPGIEYVTVDPTYKYDNSDIPMQQWNDKKEDWFWLNAGGDDQCQ